MGLVFYFDKIRGAKLEEDGEWKDLEIGREGYCCFEFEYKILGLCINT